MEFSFKPTMPRAEGPFTRGRQVAVLRTMTAVGFGLFIFASDKLTHALRKFSLCLVQSLLGLPCPGCGITTALRLALHGKLSDAITVNPAWMVVATFFVTMAALGVLELTRIARYPICDRAALLADRALLICLCFLWIVRLAASWNA